MAFVFRNSPLIELIAEIRWATQIQHIPGGQPQGQPMGLIANQGPHENFFSHFASLVLRSGFEQQERLIPPHFPMFAHQAVMRFRSSTQPSVLYQVGPGLFTANAIAPYRSWDGFEPVIRAGVDALIASRPEAERDVPFASTHLRYLDAFPPQLSRGLPISRFISEVLGIRTELPDGISRHLKQDHLPKTSLQFQIPMENQAILSLSVGEGAANGGAAIVMDTNVATTGQFPNDVDALMRSLNNAHEVIHDVFYSITRPIYDLMGVVEVNDDGR